MTEERKGPWWRKYTKKYLEEEPEKPVPEKEEREAEAPARSWDPFSELETMHKQIDSVFRNLFSRDVFRFPEMPATIKMKEGVFRKPRSSVRETEKEVLVAVEMPGVKKEDIKIKIEGLNLIIDAQTKRERREEREGFVSARASYKGFRNIIRLPCEVLKEKSKARYEQGILKIVLPKKEVSEGPSDISIE